MQLRTISQTQRTKTGQAIVASGYGIRIKVERHHLIVDDGIGRDRKTQRFARGLTGARRLVILGATGTISLGALQWLRDIDIAVVQVVEDGALLLQCGAHRRTDSALRRAQVLAATNDVGLKLTKNLIAEKITRQSNVLEKYFSGHDQINISEVIHLINNAQSLEDVRNIEAISAAIYWEAWGSLRISWIKKDVSHLPDHWKTFSARRSPLTNSPRSAVDPLNAMLNYLYSLLEVETENALIKAGLDRGMGILHSDSGNRDSFALDVMEPIRPMVDEWLLSIITSRTFAAREFYERRDGSCRLMPEISSALCGAMAEMRPWIEPIVARVVRTLEGATPKAPITAASAPRNVPLRVSMVTSKPKDQIAKQRRQVAKPLGTLCLGCGITLNEGGRSYCDECIDGHTEDSVRRRIIAAQSKLETMRQAGDNPVQRATVRNKIGAAVGRRNKEAAAWLASGATAPSREVYFNEILPNLQRVTLSQIQEATGLSNPYCSRIRSGKFVPHPRHWEALEHLP